MTHSERSKLICFSVLLTAVTFCQVWARPNANYGTQDNRASNTMALRSHHKGKRAWDLPYASDTQDDPVISLVEEGELGKTDTTSNDPSGTADKADPMWLDIGKDFPETKTITFNSDGVLECEAVGSPPPKIFWLKNGMPIETMTIVTNEESVKNRLEIGNNVLYDKFGHSGMANVKSKLPIKCAQPEDQAHYTCVAVNRGKQVSATTHLSVIAEETTTKASRGSCEYRLAMFSYKKSKKGSSAFVISSESFHMETMGRHVVLPCRSVGKPRPQVYWLDQDGKKIVSGKKYQVSSSGSLVIRNLAWKDMGVFTCVAENIFGKDTATTFVYPLSEEPTES